MSYGVTSTGFNIKPLSQCTTELNTAYQNYFGSNIPLDGNSLFGELIAIHAQREADLWQVAQDIYLNSFPDSATASSLDNAATLTGHIRLGNILSQVTATITGTATTVIPAGSQASVTGTANVFQTIADYTIGGGGTVSAVFNSVLPGPIPALATTLTTIVTPIAGWTSVSNPADAVLGRVTETDPVFRARRNSSFVVATGGALQAVQNAVLLVAGVTFCGGVENRTDATVSSMPPHSMQMYVIGGADLAVAQAIWGAKPAGCATYGTYGSYLAVDSFGNNQSISFSRSTNVPMYLDVTVTSGAGYPADGVTQIQTALVNYITGLSFGVNVNNWQLVASLGGIPGISNVVILQGTAPSPGSSANTTITAAQKATLITGNIVMH